jgi:hypothetical protein
MNCKFGNCKTNVNHICDTCNNNFCKSHSVKCSVCKKQFCHYHWEDHARHGHKDFNIKFQ